MALQKKIILNNGLTVQNAYIRIDTVSGYKGGLDISVNSYVLQTNFQAGGYAGQKNFIKQGYEHLKTLDIYRNKMFAN